MLILNAPTLHSRYERNAHKYRQKIQKTLKIITLYFPLLKVKNDQSLKNYFMYIMVTQQIFTFHEQARIILTYNVYITKILKLIRNKYHYIRLKFILLFI